MPRTSAHLKGEKRTQEQMQKDFLLQFCETANVSTAAKKAKVGRRTVYDWLEADVTFRKKFRKAGSMALGVLEDEAVRRAVEGTAKPVYQKGKKVGSVQEYSDTLLIVLLKARAPKKYKDRVHQELTGKGGKPIKAQVTSNVDYTQLPSEVLEAIVKARKAGE